MNADGIPLLIVEDNPVYAEILQRLLPALGTELRFSSKWVDTAEKALEEVQGNHYELVLLDYKLPGADGLTVLSHIRSLPKGQQPAVIMLTGMGNEAVAVEAMKSGAMDYLAKDYLDVPSLIRAITTALERKRLEEQVARYTAELREKNAQMETDLNMARELQQALLPHQYPVFPRTSAPKESCLRFCHCYHPTTAVGGDFFDVLPLSDSEAGVFICDVMGHGVRAALVTAIVRALVEELTPMAGDPGQFLTQINRDLLRILKQTRMPLFASAFYLVADVNHGEVRYSNAGHPAPLYVRRSAGAVEPMRDAVSRPGPALGVFEDSVYSACQRMLAAGDLVVLFTDGLYEVAGANDEEYGQERLLEAVRKRMDLPPAQLFDELLAEVQRFSGGKEFVDDVCLVGMEATRVGPAITARGGA
jgi:serine phosphatase RsbU (regulator of sigma subunit)